MDFSYSRQGRCCTLRFETESAARRETNTHRLVLYKRSRAVALRTAANAMALSMKALSQARPEVG